MTSFCIFANWVEDKCINENTVCEFDNENNLTKIEVFQETKIVERHLFDNRVYLGGFSLKYGFDILKNTEYIEEFEIFNDLTKSHKSYSINSDFSIEKYQSRASNKAMIVEIDGIDFRHHVFEKKLFVNPYESLNESDDDLNGLKDDLIGFTFSNKRSSNFHVVEPVITKNHLLDADHGTSVMHIASKNITKTSFIPVSGDMREKFFYEHIKRYIQGFDVRFINMSFCFGVDNNIRLSSENNFQGARQSITELIHSQKDTLFITAAGNGYFMLSGMGGVNVDKWPHYPASIISENKITVGAILASEINKDEMNNYKMAIFSNYGIRRVDILAPGSDIRAASAGGGFSLNTGTSFSAPYVLNIALKIFDSLPDLSIFEIKELILKTAYIPDIDVALNFNINYIPGNEDFKKYPNFFPVRSGGIVNPEKIEEVISILKSNGDLSVEEAIILSYKNSELTTKLKKFWKSRNL